MANFTFIPLSNLDVYTGTVGPNVDFAAVVGNARTVRIPAPTIFGQFVMMSPAPSGPEQDEGQHATTKLAVDASGVYTYASGNGWGKSPRVNDHWDDFTDTTRLFVMHKQMTVSPEERANARATLDIGIANTARAGLVRETTSSEITLDAAYTALYQSVYNNWDPESYERLFSNTEYEIAFPEYSATEATASWRAGLTVSADGGDAYVRYATSTRPGAVLIGGTNPMAAATMGSLAALVKWVIDQWQLQYKLAENYEGPGAVDGVSADLSAGIIKADSTGGTLLVREDGSAYVPVATTDHSGVVQKASDFRDVGASVPDMDTLRAFAEALVNNIFTTYPGGAYGEAGVVIPRPDGAIFQCQTTATGTKTGTGVVDVRPAATESYGAVYVVDAWPDVNETNAEIPVTPPEGSEFPDGEYSRYRKVPTYDLVWSWKQAVEAEIGNVQEGVDNVYSSLPYASDTRAGAIRYGRALSTGATNGGDTITNVNLSNANQPGVVYAVTNDTEYSATSAGKEANSRVVPTVEYVTELLKNYSQGTPTVAFATSASAGTVEIVEPGGNTISQSGAPLVPTLSYLDNVLAGFEGGGSGGGGDSSGGLTYEDVSRDYRADTIYGQALKQYIYEDVISWVGTGGGGGGGSEVTLTEFNALKNRVAILEEKVLALEAQISTPASPTTLTLEEVDDLIQTAAETTQVRVRVQEPLLQATVVTNEAGTTTKVVNAGADVAIEDTGESISGITDI